MLWELKGMVVSDNSTPYPDMEFFLNIRLGNPDKFHRTILDELMAIQRRGAMNIECETDRILASTAVEFIISFNDKTILYIEDFSFFFGYQISAYKRTKVSGKQTEVLSFSGNKVLFNKDKIQIISKNKDVILLTNLSLKTYFVKLLDLLFETIAFLKLKGFSSEDLNNFEHDLKSFLQ